MSRTLVSVRDVENALRELGIEGQPIEVHVSVRSFGGLEDGPATIVDGVLRRRTHRVAVDRRRD